VGGPLRKRDGMVVRGRWKMSGDWRAIFEFAKFRGRFEDTRAGFDNQEVSKLGRRRARAVAERFRYYRAEGEGGIVGGVLHARCYTPTRKKG